jgi:hypothetical protein
VRGPILRFRARDEFGILLGVVGAFYYTCSQYGRSPAQNPNYSIWVQEDLVFRECTQLANTHLLIQLTAAVVLVVDCERVVLLHGTSWVVRIKFSILEATMLSSILRRFQITRLSRNPISIMGNLQYKKTNVLCKKTQKSTTQITSAQLPKPTKHQSINQSNSPPLAPLTPTSAASYSTAASRARASQLAPHSRGPLDWVLKSAGRRCSRLCSRGPAPEHFRPHAGSILRARRHVTRIAGLSNF